jgi:DNA invertase Pin-like site-specific DNA recombinase
LFATNDAALVADGQRSVMSDPQVSDLRCKPSLENTDTGPRVRALGYLRVSTEEQVQGNGLAVQEQAIRRYCKANGLRLVDLCSDEGISGSNGLEKRVGLATALARLESGEADCLVVYRLDRLARDYVLQELLVNRLRGAGTPLRSATEDIETDTDDPTKVLIRQILGSIGQYERALIRGRMLAGKAIKQARGGYVGGQPGYGSRADNAELVDDPREAEVVQMVMDMREAGASYREIAGALTAAGLKPRRAASWHPMVIRSIALGQRQHDQ